MISPYLYLVVAEVALLSSSVLGGMRTVVLDSPPSCAPAGCAVAGRLSGLCLSGHPGRAGGWPYSGIAAS